MYAEPKSLIKHTKQMSDRGVIDWQTKKIDINPPLIQINQKLFDFTELKGEIQVYGALSMRCTSGYGLCIVVRLANFKTVQQTVQQTSMVYSTEIYISRFLKYLGSSTSVL